MPEIRKPNKKKSLRTIGVDDAALFLPSGYNDCTKVINSFDARHLEQNQTYVFECHLYQEPSTKWKHGKPLTTFAVTDHKYVIRFSLFGDVRAQVEAIKALKAEEKPFYVKGEIQITNDVYIYGAVIISESDVGKIKPIYNALPGKSKKVDVGAIIENHLIKSIPIATEKLRAILGRSFDSAKAVRKYLNIEPSTNLEQLLMEVHQPTTLESAEKALNTLKKISAIVVADELIEKSKSTSTISKVAPITGLPLHELTKNIPFDLTQEQAGIVQRIIDSISVGELVDMLLIGDVGTGKTVTYSIPAAFLGTAGGRVAILLPNGNLARQIHSEFIGYFPNILTCLVTSDSKLSSNELRSANVLVGTTALLFSEVGEFDLVIVDEQQKLSTEQRGSLVTGGRTHTINVSATPIPRTMALACFNALRVETIRHCHAKKEIHTRIMEGEQGGAVIESEIGWTIFSANKKALIVCAKKENDESGEDCPILTAQCVFEYYNQRMPGLVTLSHSGLSVEENEQAISEIKSGAKRLLISTTVVEIGMTIDELVYVAVFNAERFGLTQLHQIRGRLVRKGGTAWFSLHLPNNVKNVKTLERLRYLTVTDDGHAIALHDLRLRGLGDIGSGNTQHGAYVGLIKNVEVDIDEIERLISNLVDSPLSMDNRSMFIR